MAKKVKQEFYDSYEVEKIIGRRISFKGIEYMVRWKGYEMDESTWEVEEHLDNCQEEVVDFEKRCSYLRKEFLQRNQNISVDLFENKGIASFIDDGLGVFSNTIPAFGGSADQAGVDGVSNQISGGVRAGRVVSNPNVRPRVATHGWNRAAQPGGIPRTAPGGKECKITKINNMLTDPALGRYYLVSWDDGYVTWERLAAFSDSLDILEKYEFKKDKQDRKKLMLALQNRPAGWVSDRHRLAGKRYLLRRGGEASQNTSGARSTLDIKPQADVLSSNSAEAGPSRTKRGDKGKHNIGDPGIPSAHTKMARSGFAFDHIPFVVPEPEVARPMVTDEEIASGIVPTSSCPVRAELSAEESMRVEWLLSAWKESRSAVLNTIRDMRTSHVVASFISGTLASACSMVPYLIIVPRSDVSAWEGTLRAVAPNAVVGMLYGDKGTLKTLLEDIACRGHWKGESKLPLSCQVVIAEFEAIRNGSVVSLLGSTSIVWQSIISHAMFITDESFRDCCRLVSQFDSTHRIIIGTSEPPRNVTDLCMVLKFLDPKQYYSKESVQRKFGLSNNPTKASIIACAEKFSLKHVVGKLNADNTVPATIPHENQHQERHWQTTPLLSPPDSSQKPPSADYCSILQSSAAGLESSHHSCKSLSPAHTRITPHINEEPTTIAATATSATMGICTTPATPASVANSIFRPDNSHAALPTMHPTCFFNLVIPVGMSRWQRILYQSIIQKNQELINQVRNDLHILKNRNLSSDRRKMSMTKLRCHLNPSCGKDLERTAIRRGVDQSGDGLIISSFNVLMDLLLEALKVTSHPYLLNGAEIALDSESGRRSTLIESSTKLCLLDQLLPRLLAQKRHIVIVAQYLGTLDIIEEYLCGSKVEFLRIDGSLQQSVIQERADHFNAKHSPVSVLISSTKSMCHSPSIITADTAVFFDSSISVDVDRAALERVAGPGQGEFVWVLHLVARDTVDERLVRHYLDTKSRISRENMSGSDVISHVHAIEIALGTNMPEVIAASYIDEAGSDSELAGDEYAAKIVDCCLCLSEGQASSAGTAIQKSFYSQESFSSEQTDVWVLSSDNTPVHITTGHPISFPAAKQTADMLHRKTAKRKATVSATGASTSSDIPAPDAGGSAKQLKLTPADVTDQHDICGGDIEMSSAPDAIIQPRTYDSVSAHEVPPSLKPVTVNAEELPVIMDIFIDRLAEIHKSHVSSKERALTSNEDATIRALFAEMFDQNVYTPTAASASRTPYLFFPVLTNLSLVPHGQPMPCQPLLSSDCPACHERPHDVSFCPAICEPSFISGVSKLKSTRCYDIHPFYMNLMSWYSIQYVWYYLGSTEGAAANARNVKLHPEYAVDARPYVTLARLQLRLLQTFQSASAEEMSQSCVEKYSEIIAAAVEKGTGIVDEMTVTDVPALQRSLSELNGMRARLLHQIRDGSNKRFGESDVPGGVAVAPNCLEFKLKGQVLCCECLSIKACRTEARITILQTPLGAPPTTTIMPTHPASASAKSAVDFAPLLNIVPNFDPVMRSRVSESAQLFDSLVALGKRSAKSGTTVRADIDSLVKLPRGWGGNLGTWLSSSPKSLNALRTIHSKCDRAAKKYVKNTGRPQPRVAELTYLLVKQLSAQTAPAESKVTAVATQQHAVTDSAIEVSAEAPKPATAEIPSFSYLSDSKISAVSLPSVISNMYGNQTQQSAESVSPPYAGRESHIARATNSMPSSVTPSPVDIASLIPQATWQVMKVLTSSHGHTIGNHLLARYKPVQPSSGTAAVPGTSAAAGNVVNPTVPSRVQRDHLWHLQQQYPMHQHMQWQLTAGAVAPIAVHPMVPAVQPAHYPSTGIAAAPYPHSKASVSVDALVYGATYCVLCDSETHRPGGCDRRMNKGFLVGWRCLVSFDDLLPETLRDMAVAVIDKYLQRLG